MGGIKLAGLGPRFTKDLLRESTFWEIFTNDLLRIYYGITKEITMWERFTKDLSRESPFGRDLLGVYYGNHHLGEIH